MRYQEAGRLQPGDYVYIFVSPRHIDLLDRLFASTARLDITDPILVGAVEVDHEKPIGWLGEQYKIPVPDEYATVPIAEFVTARLGGTAERGDRVTCGPLDLVVRSVDEAGNPTAVGLGIPDGERVQARQGRLAGLVRRLRTLLRPPPRQ